MVTEQPLATHRRINEAEQPGLRDEESSEPAHLRSSRSTSGSVSPATVDNGEFKETTATETTAQRELSTCAVWSRSHRSQSILRPRSNASHGSKTRRTATAPRKRWATAPSRPCSLRSDHNHATDAAFATAMLHSVNFASSPDIEMQRPAVRPPSVLAASALRRPC